MRRQEGFTLIEILVAIALASVILTLGASALRSFWLVRSLEGGADGAVTQLRELQESAVSETHPIVFGAHFDVGTSDWRTVRYDPRLAPGSQCSIAGTRRFDTGVLVQSAAFEADEAASAACIPLIPGSTDTEFVFFFARGSATGGSLTLTHPSLGGRLKTVTVLPITGRVDES